MAAPPGLGLEGARWLAEEAEAMCVGVDAGGEALPPEEEGSFLPVHSYLLADAGMPIFENLWLEELAAREVAEFVFLAFPLKLLGSTGLPVRPVAFPYRK
jgi:kynurenine formamidase